MRFLVASVFVISMIFIPSVISLVMTSGGTYKVILGYSIPLDLPMPMGINYVHNFQFQYPTVDNASQVSYVQQGARRSKAITRNQFYGVIENMLDNSSLDRTCLLRSICDSSSSPFTHSGIIGEILQSLLTPHNIEEINPYTKAWQSGQLGKDCLLLYPKCPQGKSILDKVSFYI